MQFIETGLAGTWLIELQPIADERGFFARTYCRKEFEQRGLETRLAQCNISFNPKAGTLRGLHWQVAPFEETKLVRCTRGAIHDVIVDIRPQSPTFRRHFAANLSAENRRLLYIPPGFAHGFITLEDNSEVFYQMSQFYDAASARGCRWDDPGLGIVWPMKPMVISERDQNLPVLGS